MLVPRRRSPQPHTRPCHRRMLHPIQDASAALGRQQHRAVLPAIAVQQPRFASPAVGRVPEHRLLARCMCSPIIDGAHENSGHQTDVGTNVSPSDPLRPKSAYAPFGAAQAGSRVVLFGILGSLNLVAGPLFEVTRWPDRAVRTHSKSTQTPEVLDQGCGAFAVCW